MIKKKNFKLFSIVTALALVMNASYVAFDSKSPNNQKEEETAIVKNTESAFNNYSGNEVYVEYQNGESNVISYGNEDELKDELETLSSEDGVSLVQPNYEYTVASVSITDADYSEQWALNNDGTFSVDDIIDENPVYEDPFEEPSNEGQFPQGPQTPPGSGNNGGNRRFSTFGTVNSTLSSDTTLSGTYSLLKNYSTFSTEEVTAVSGVDINMEDAWNTYNGGKREVIVAIIDTGIDYTHEDLEDAIWTNTDEIADDGIDNDSNGYIDDVYGWNFYNNSNDTYVGSEDSHGTHGAGTIAASLNTTGIAGIAGDSTVKIMSIKALGGSEGTGTTESIIAAIKYAEANGASICNLSFGTSSNDKALKSAIANSDMLFVAAAGNGDDWTGAGENTDNSPVYPASYDLDNIISVANLQYDGTLHSSSNYGVKTVDIAAPGTYILSTTPENTYSYMTGTSMAAPMVTGVAALVYSQYTDITLSQVKGVILASANTLDNLTDYVKSGGMLDANAALAYDYTSITTDTEEDTTSETDSTAPVISITTKTANNRKYITVTVTDEGDNLETVLYQKGTCTVDDFSDGTVGKTVTLDEDNSKTYRVAKSGTYTFYAIDSAGNESVKVVTIK